MSISRLRIVLGIAVMLVTIMGCGTGEEVVTEKRPRPVITELLKKRSPPSASLITASAGAWKTEQIGFEVGGRVEFVVEENSKIEGRIFDAEEKLLFAGDPIARLESERFRLAVAKAKADVETAEQNVRSAQTELEGSIPAQIAAAVARRKAAEADFSRSKKLVARNAGSRSELDQNRANYDSAVAEVQQLQAMLKAQESQIASQKSVLEQTKQGLRDAQRNLEDCTLYSSFTGQVAEALVVPGSIVQAGAPVVTLQMMDPIKVELEVSAEVSRRLSPTDLYPVYVTMPSGQVEVHQGYLNQIDVIADPLTRTYTVTLLVINRKFSAIENPSVATTPNIWRLDLPFLPGASEGKLFVEEKAILRDDQGAYLWQITNATTRSRTPNGHGLEVRKIRITLGDLKAPYFGSHVFQEVVVEDEGFDPRLNLVIGELSVSEGKAENWNGKLVFVDAGNRWMLRPGDLVKVDLSSGNRADGYFVPLNAIARSNDQTAIFVLAESGGEGSSQSIARRIPVEMIKNDQENVTSSVCQIRAIGDVPLEGMRVIVQGTHYLIDGEPVNAVSPPEDSGLDVDDSLSKAEGGI